jgi:membrane-anchored protein YejM (alkaline phosphatase superfamily)
LAENVSAAEAMIMDDPFLLAKVQVLLAEHATLRAEIVARIGHVYQLIGAGIVVLTVLLITLNPFKLKFLGNVASRSDRKRSQVLFASMAILFLCVFVWSTASYVRDANRIAQRLR